MMKLIGSNQWRDYAISRVFRLAFFSAEARKDCLYDRISGCGDPNTCITPLLDQWLQEGQRVNHSELQKLIRQLRKYRRYTHALEIQEWMTGKLNYDLNSGGIAVQLDLISKVHGITKAEDYYNSVGIASRDEKIHGAMLNCYAEKKSLEKADRLFQKMTVSGFVKTALTYNVMLSLYSRMGKNEKFDSLVRAMKENGVEGDTYTSNIRLNAYANSNIDEMEKLLANIEADSQGTVDFHSYFVAAKGYAKNGRSEKASAVLEKAEKTISTIGNRINYEQLIALHAEIGHKDEVYRIWNVYKSMGKVYNTGYISMLSSLLKLEDFEGAEKISGEWESGPTKFDVRIENLFITAYCKKGILGKALERAERVTEKGHRLEAGMWQCLATQCCVEGSMDKAVEMTKLAISSRGAKSKLNRSTLCSCLEHLKRRGDLEPALEILGLVRESGCLENDVCDRLVEFVKSDKDSGALGVMKESGRKKSANLDVDGAQKMSNQNLV